MSQEYDFKTKVALAEMLKGGVIMDVTNLEQAKIAEEAGAVSVMALERIPSDIRKDGGVARMSNPHMIKEIQDNVSIPVMADDVISCSITSNGDILSVFKSTKATSFL